MTWLERKEKRREHFARFVNGWRMVTCTACNGSGRYDHNGAPSCGACSGTGKVKVPPSNFQMITVYQREITCINPPHDDM